MASPDNRNLAVIWTKRGVVLEVVKVYESGKRRVTNRIYLTPTQAKTLACNLRGKP